MGGVAVNKNVRTERAESTNPDIVDLHYRVESLEQQSQDRERASGSNTYLSGSNIIAGISLLVAALSVVFSIIQYNRSQVSQRRAELIEYTRQVIAWSADSENHTNEISAISSQAAALLPTVPDVPPIIYRTLAEGLITDTADLDRAESLLNEAQARAETSNNVAEEIYAHRLKARIAYIDRDVSAMRRERAISVSISDSYSGRHKTTFVYSFGGFSRVFWAQDEAVIGSCRIAREQLAKAIEINTTYRNTSLETEIEEAQRNLDTRLAALKGKPCG
jgi:hypothetical protein